MTGSTKFGSMKRRLMILGIVSVFGVAVAEVGARVVSQHFRQRVMTYDPIVGWRPIPGAQLLEDAGNGSYQVSINSAGLRDIEYPVQAVSSHSRMLILGDSLCFGYGGVSHPEIFSEILETHLQNVDVINLGVPGFSTDQQHLYLQQVGLQYQPSVVLLCLYQDDFSASFESFIPTMSRPKGRVRLVGKTLEFLPPQFSWYFLLVENSMLAGAVESQIGLVPYLQPRPRSEATMTQDNMDKTYRLMLKAILQQCQSRQVTLAMMIQPGYLLTPEQDHTRRIANEFASDRNVPLLDLNDCAPFQEPDAVSKYCFDDRIHLNRSGHQHVETNLREFVSELELFPTELQE